jgi:hypothetical protein
MIEPIAPPVEGHEGRRRGLRLDPYVGERKTCLGNGSSASENGSQEGDPHPDQAGEDAGSDKLGMWSGVERKTGDSPHTRSKRCQLIREKIGV